MRKLIAIAALLCLVGVAQQTRHEVTNSSGAADAKPNSAAVPDVYAIGAQFQRVMIFRFRYDTDLLAGLQKMVKENKIQNAVILSGFGSVRGYQVHQVSNRTFPSKNMFVQDPTAPADIAGMSGFVLNGRLHPHITLANPEKAFGGHLEPGTRVFTFAVVTLGVLPDNLDLSKLDDKNYR
ncbi:MAG TPA: PPC domain-containing DNA-binding protein [Bryobacteraceae bacterium]|nr:PPC domain-containing DNA-binding protein [Bryobacteraceae bacterium]